VLFAQVRVVEELLTATEKRALVAALTDAVVCLCSGAFGSGHVGTMRLRTALGSRKVSVKGEHVRDLTWVLLDELRSGDCGIGGHVLTTNDVRALAAGALL